MQNYPFFKKTAIFLTKFIIFSLYIAQLIKKSPTFVQHFINNHKVKPTLWKSKKIRK